MSEQGFLSRGQARPEQLDQGYRSTPDKKGDCGCNKPFPFSEILPRDSSYLEFAKNKELVAFGVTDIGIRCTNILTYVNNLKDFYPEIIISSQMEGLKQAVADLESQLSSLKGYLEDQESKAKQVLDSDGSWIMVSNNK